MAPFCIAGALATVVQVLVNFPFLSDFPPSTLLLPELAEMPACHIPHCSEPDDWSHFHTCEDLLCLDLDVPTVPSLGISYHHTCSFLGLRSCSPLLYVTLVILKSCYICSSVILLCSQWKAERIPSL